MAYFNSTKIFLIILFIISNSFEEDTNEKKAYGQNKEEIKEIERKMYSLALEEILIDFLEQLIVLNAHIELEFETFTMGTLLNLIEYAELDIVELEHICSEILSVIQTNQIIKEWDHLKYHIIIDFKTKVKPFLKSEYNKFRVIINRISTREEFKNALDALRGTNKRKNLDIVTIFMYWYDAITHFRQKETATNTLRKAIFDRLALERPYFGIRSK